MTRPPQKGSESVTPQESRGASTERDDQSEQPRQQIKGQIALFMEGLIGVRNLTVHALPSVRDSGPDRRLLPAMRHGLTSDRQW